MATDHSSVKKITKTLFLLVCCVLNQKVLPITGQTLPSFDSCPSPLVVSEDSEIGTTLFSVRANVNEDSFPANNLTFTLESMSTEELVNVTQATFNSDPGALWRWSSHVILRAALDRDFEPSSRALSFGAVDTNNNKAILICNMNILDVNDNPPSFQGLPFDVEVSEMTAVGSMVKSGISASDPDTVVGGQVFLSAQFSDSYVEATFNTSTTVQGSGQVMDIILAQQLDYETRTFYTFTIRAVDGGGLESRAEVRVTVTDAQDTPPVFLLDTYRAALREHRPVGTPVITVSAVDGDRDPPNGIIYSIAQGRGDYFTINNVTGSITSLVELDRDNVTMVNTDGVFQLTIRAAETDEVQPQYGNTTTEVEVVVVVEDINDHPPTFSRVSPYTAFVREDTPAGALIYFDGDGYISVSDADQGRNSHFNLTVERDGVPWPVLAATPSEVYSEGLVLLRVMEAEALRQFAGQHISLQLVAWEPWTAEHLSSTADIIITVERLPEPSPTPAPTLEDTITAPDVVVFIIGFLVVFNVVATACIIWFIRRRGEEPRQGLARRGSKYYVHGVEKESRGSSGFQNGSAVSLRSENVLVEVDAKDRCDVVPLSAVAENNNHRVSDPDSLNEPRPVNGSVVDDHSTDRKVLLHNEISPAKSIGGSLSSSVDSVSGEAIPTAVVASTQDDLPNFSKARRNVSTPRNPALTFSVPQVSSAESRVLTSVAGTSASRAAAAGASSTPSTSAESVSVEPVTRFSAKGEVSTTTVAAAEGLKAGGPTPAFNSTSGWEGARPAPSGGDSENRSMSEILY